MNKLLAFSVFVALFVFGFWGLKRSDHRNFVELSTVEEGIKIAQIKLQTAAQAVIDGKQAIDAAEIKLAEMSGKLASATWILKNAQIVEAASLEALEEAETIFEYLKIEAVSARRDFTAEKVNSQELMYPTEGKKYRPGSTNLSADSEKEIISQTVLTPESVSTSKQSGVQSQDLFESSKEELDSQKKHQSVTSSPNLMRDSIKSTDNTKPKGFQTSENYSEENIKGKFFQGTNSTNSVIYISKNNSSDSKLPNHEKSLTIVQRERKDGESKTDLTKDITRISKDVIKKLGSKSVLVSERDETRIQAAKEAFSRARSAAEEAKFAVSRASVKLETALSDKVDAESMLEMAKSALSILEGEEHQARKALSETKATLPGSTQKN